MSIGHFHNVTDAFVYFTECQLATLEHLQGLKRTPRHELERHRGIALNMVEHCRRLILTLPEQGCPRLHRILTDGDRTLLGTKGDVFPPKEKTP